MNKFPYNSALIVGAGSGVSASVARALSAYGVKVGLVARTTDKLRALCQEIGAWAYAADASRPDEIEAAFQNAERDLGPIDIAIYNAGAPLRGALLDLDPVDVAQAVAALALGGFMVTQQAARRMVPRGRGAILLTGATASTIGFPRSTPFAMGKFALRGLSQSAARELGPQGIHVAHVIIDGLVRSERHSDRTNEPDSTLDPVDIAQVYIDLLRQNRSAWSSEVDLRPWCESF